MVEVKRGGTEKEGGREEGGAVAPFVIWGAREGKLKKEGTGREGGRGRALCYFWGQDLGGGGVDFRWVRTWIAMLLGSRPQSV